MKTRPRATAIAPPWYQPFVKAGQAGTYLIVHTLVAGLIVALITLLQWFVQTIGDPKLFGVVPVEWFFHAMDAGVLVVFIWNGLHAAVRAFRE